eukprot:CAMPEP_0198683802 /NCGR_PEP_ID=MMETSP1468-20131203/11225_1 /TAXON_ID=1461545 /ORGANISM="Mantoniella sp, Strain CCMP1436" /LENGTH=212 /DNA_ID=CAMNT_0044428127 /DNA_START=151 /DNA_END=790 /DNA_ORIENTATION=-
MSAQSSPRSLDKRGISSLDPLLPPPFIASLVRHAFSVIQGPAGPTRHGDAVLTLVTRVAVPLTPAAAAPHIRQCHMCDSGSRLSLQKLQYQSAPRPVLVQYATNASSDMSEASSKFSACQWVRILLARSDSFGRRSLHGSPLESLAPPTRATSLRTCISKHGCGTPSLPSHSPVSVLDAFAVNCAGTKIMSSVYVEYTRRAFLIASDLPMSL